MSVELFMFRASGQILQPYDANVLEVDSVSRLKSEQILAFSTDVCIRPREIFHPFCFADNISA